MAFSAIPAAPSELGRFSDSAERSVVRVFRETTLGRLGIHDDRQETSLWITSRNADTYKNLFSVINLDQEEGPQFIESGGGLGGFLPDLLRRNTRIPPPIVIDPIEYAWVRLQLENLLLLPQVHALGEHIAVEIKTLIGRCDVYESAQVQHIALPLRQACKQFPNLVEQGDAVIDTYGGVTYESVEEAHDIPPIVHLFHLLKSDGRLYSTYPCARGFLKDWQKDKEYYLQCIADAECGVHSS